MRELTAPSHLPPCVFVNDGCMRLPAATTHPGHTSPGQHQMWDALPMLQHTCSVDVGLQPRTPATGTCTWLLHSSSCRFPSHSCGSVGLGRSAVSLHAGLVAGRDIRLEMDRKRAAERAHFDSLGVRWPSLTLTPRGSPFGGCETWTGSARLRLCTTRCIRSHQNYGSLWGNEV